MGKQPFDTHKASLRLPPKPEGHRRIWLHLWPDRASFAAYKQKQTGKGRDWDDAWDPSQVTDDYDDIYGGECERWRDRLGIGTVVVVAHELRHIFLNGPDEDGVRNDNDEHHHLPIAPHRGPDGKWHIRKGPTCAALGLCVGADHGARFLPVHTGGVPRSLAHDLLDTARMQGPDENGVRHGWVDVPEETIWAERA